MNIGDKIGTYYDTHFQSGHVPLEIDEDLHTSLTEENNGKLLKVQPYPENEGIKAGEELLRSIHQEKSQLLGLINNSEVDTFEIWFSDRVLSFHFYVETERTERKLRKQIDAHYPNSKVDIEEVTMPNIEEGDWVAGSELVLKKSYLYPLKNPMGVNDFNSDPYRSITSDMVVGGRENIMVQIVFKPAHPSWSVGGIGGTLNPFTQSAEELADEIRNEKLVEETISTRQRRPIGSENQLANEIARQREMSAYNANIRVLSFSENKQEASANAWSVSRAFEQSYKEAGGQSLVQIPRRGYELRDLLQNAKERKFVDRKMIITIPEMASIAHIPNQSIETPAIEWNNKSTTRLPAIAERFNAPLNANYITLMSNPNVPVDLLEEDEPDEDDAIEVDDDVDIDELIEQEKEEQEQKHHGGAEDGDITDEGDMGGSYTPQETEEEHPPEPHQEQETDQQAPHGERETPQEHEDEYSEPQPENGYPDTQPPFDDGEFEQDYSDGAFKKLLVFFGIDDLTGSSDFDEKFDPAELQPQQPQQPQDQYPDHGQNQENQTQSQ